MKIKHIIHALACLAAIAFASGCDQNKSGPVATAPTGETTAKSDDAAPLPEATELFVTAGPATAVPANTPTDIELNITPSAGFKINKRFDWNFEFHPNDAVQFEPATVEGDALKLSDEKATIPVKVRAMLAGEHVLTATGNFSVCNDDKCELYRDRTVTFKMAATDG